MALLATAAVALFAIGCGDDSPSGARTPAGRYEVKVVKADFPAKQGLGQTSLLRLGVRNTGKRTVPALTISMSIGGKEGQASSLPFALRSPEPGLAQPDRPVWVLSEHYPKLVGSDRPGGAENASSNTFDFGPLKAGATTEAVWKLSAVKAGRFTLLYNVDASLGGEARAVSANGGAVRGSLPVTVSSTPPDTTVTDSGEVVTIPRGAKAPTG